MTTARYYAGRAPVRPVIGDSGTENSLDWDLLGLDSDTDTENDVDEATKIERDLSENRLIGKAFLAKILILVLL